MWDGIGRELMNGDRKEEEYMLTIWKEKPWEERSLQSGWESKPW